ncbi:hypothetical protein L7F22_054275 [Adiantum nelumboides]|nr:hypothetical protein [Adiantum nelumboides]
MAASLLAPRLPTAPSSSSGTTDLSSRLAFSHSSLALRLPSRPPSHQHGTWKVIAMAPPKPSGKAKKVVAVVKLALEAGKATPAPPVGPALGSKGVNIMAFCKEYNAKTADKAGYVIPVEITVFDVSARNFAKLLVRV